jgi:hypothetical protein
LKISDGVSCITHGKEVDWIRVFVGTLAERDLGMDGRMFKKYDVRV